MLDIKESWDKIVDPKVQQLAALALRESGIEPAGDLYIYPFNEVYQSTRKDIEALLSGVFGEAVNLDVHAYRNNPEAELAEDIMDLIRSVPIPQATVDTEGTSFDSVTSHMVIQIDDRNGEDFNALIQKLGIPCDPKDGHGYFVTTEPHLRSAGFTIKPQQGTAVRPQELSLGYV